MPPTIRTTWSTASTLHCLCLHVKSEKLTDSKSSKQKKDNNQKKGSNKKKKHDEQGILVVQFISISRFLPKIYSPRFLPFLGIPINQLLSNIKYYKENNICSKMLPWSFEFFEQKFFFCPWVSCFKRHGHLHGKIQMTDHLDI